MIAIAGTAVPTFDMPSALQARGFAVRAQTPADGEAAMICLAAARWDELAQTGWTEAEKWAFLAQQSEAQQRHYGTHYAEGEFTLIECQGQLAGRLYLFRGETDIRIVDIALLPAVRGQGIGGELLRAIQREAQAHGRSVSIHVERHNPAQRLYQRLGFVADEANSNGVYLRMDWRAA